jgi:N-acetylglucosamine-6-phosphate deacetylase
MQILARHYQTGQAMRVTVEKGMCEKLENSEINPPEMPWIAPGLVDVQINGSGGVDFNRGPIDADSWIRATDNLFRHGCTHFLIALMTNLRQSYRDLLGQIERLRRADPRNCVGYHFEGPFLNPQPGYHGAHCAEWMSPPRVELFGEWQELTGGKVRLVTLAPEVELEAGLEFIRYLGRQNVLASLGHSAVMGAELEQAVAAGASCWTHLGNAAPNPPEDKFRNVIFYALAQERLLATLIPDGQHLPPHVFRVMARALGERLMLTTDAMAGAGAGPGHYTLCHMEIDVGEELTAHIPGQPYLAGSTLMPFAGVFLAAGMSGLPWPQMWDAFSIRPARWLGLDHGLEAGKPANFCLFEMEPKPRLIATYHQGEKVFSA